MNTSKVSEIAQVIRTSVLRPAEDAVSGVLKRRRRVHPRPPSGGELDEAAVVVAEVVATRLSFKLAGGRVLCVLLVPAETRVGGREGERVETWRAK